MLELSILRRHSRHLLSAGCNRPYGQVVTRKLVCCRNGNLYRYTSHAGYVILDGFNQKIEQAKNSRATITQPVQLKS